MKRRRHLGQHPVRLAQKVCSETSSSASRSRARARSLRMIWSGVYRWRAAYGGMKRIVANKEVEIEGPKEIAKGNW